VNGPGIEPIVKSDAVKQVSLAEVPASRKSVIANLIQLYKYDFSGFSAVGSGYGEVSADGLFVYEGLDLYWQEDGRVAFTIHADSRLAGFALVNRWSALDRPLDHAVGEFFVMRKYRRHRVGARAAKLLFERLRGRWEVAVAWYNPPALAFWRAVVASVIEGPLEECLGDGKRWTGPVLCFDTRR
jgi:predicted acetyltransferase